MCSPTRAGNGTLLNRWLFSGQAGGHLAGLPPFIGEVLGVRAAPIEYRSEGKRRSLHLGNVADVLHFACDRVCMLDKNCAQIGVLGEGASLRAGGSEDPLQGWILPKGNPFRTKVE